MGLNHSGCSYDGTLWISAVGCRDMLPDADLYGRYLRESFNQLMSALDLQPDASSESHRSSQIAEPEIACIPGWKDAYRAR